jgi:methionyl-tRNA formyltransferase
VRTLADFSTGRVKSTPQPEVGVTYARKIDKDEATIDWRKPCFEIDRRLRALRPVPGARSWLRGEQIKFWSACCVAQSGTPGTVLSGSQEGLVIACGEGALRVKRLQRAGGTKLEAEEFLRGFPIRTGERFGPAR